MLLVASSFWVYGQSTIPDQGLIAYKTICELYDGVANKGSIKRDSILHQQLERNIPIVREWAQQSNNDSALARCALIHWHHLSWQPTTETYDLLVVGKELWRLRNALPSDDLLNVLGHLSSLYQKTKRPSDRLEVALEKCAQKKKVESISHCDELSAVYHDLHQYQTAIEYYWQDIELRKEEEKWFQVASILNNIGLAYRDLGVTDQAEYHFKRSLSLLRSDSMKMTAVKPTYLNHFQLVVQWNLAHVQHQGITAAKVDLAKDLIVSASSATEYFWVLKAYMLLAKSDYENGYLQNARSYADSALVLAKQTKHLDSWINALHLKGKILLVLGKQKEAEAYFIRSTALSDSVRLAEAALDANIAAAQFEAKKRDEELKVSREKERATALEAKREREQRFLTTGLFAVSLIILLLVAVLLWLSRKNRKLIAKQKDQLEVSLSEKEVLLKEIHHRVKNNLQIISSLLDLQSIQMDPGAAKEALEEGKNRVQSIAILHHQLYQHDDLGSVGLNAFIVELSHQVMGLLKHPGIDVKLRIDVDETLIDIDTAVPLGLILNELLTNSFKYAFSKEKEGRIEITMGTKTDGETGDEMQTIVYRDNGPGLPSETNFLQAKTLGLRLIGKLSKQFKGSSSYRYNGGAEFTIQLP